MEFATKKGTERHMKSTSSFGGDESAVVNVLYNISKLRYKANKTQLSYW